MSRKHYKHKKQIALSLSRQWFPIFSTIFVLLIVGFVTVVVILFHHPDESVIPIKTVAKLSTLKQQQSAVQHSFTKYFRKAKSLQDLVNIQAEQIAGMDIAEMNLLCTQNLPGAQNINIDRCLTKLDEWARRVQFETERHLYRVTDMRFAEHYHHSESYYRAEILLQVLQEDCGVKYNPERIRNIDFTNSKDLFIHGMIDDSNGGTCASMPVLYVAVGRRLGYPLCLVPAKGHLFVRWEDKKDRFNIEGTGSGFSSYPDEYYHTWPLPLNENEKTSGQFLVSLTSSQELATFLATRGHCLYDIKQYSSAAHAYSYALKFDPSNSLYPKWLKLVNQAMIDPDIHIKNHQPL
jgi:tetratricopeptide (TPR) repeat protein